MFRDILTDTTNKELECNSPDTEHSGQIHYVPVLFIVNTSYSCLIFLTKSAIIKTMFYVFVFKTMHVNILFLELQLGENQEQDTGKFSL